jgi:hypothetical protein
MREIVLLQLIRALLAAASQEALSDPRAAEIVIRSVARESETVRTLGGINDFEARTLARVLVLAAASLTWGHTILTCDFRRAAA